MYLVPQFTLYELGEELVQSPAQGSVLFDVGGSPRLAIGEYEEAYFEPTTTAVSIDHLRDQCEASATERIEEGGYAMAGATDVLYEDDDQVRRVWGVTRLGDNLVLRTAPRTARLAEISSESMAAAAIRRRELRVGVAWTDTEMEPMPLSAAESVEDRRLRRLAPSRSPQLLRNQIVELGAMANGQITRQIQQADQERIDAESWHKVTVTGFSLGANPDSSPVMELGADLAKPLAEDSTTKHHPRRQVSRAETSPGFTRRFVPGSTQDREQAGEMLREVLLSEHPGRHDELASLLCWVIEGGPSRWPL